MLVVAGLLAIPFFTILSSVAWGWRHGTLTETPRELIDWEFERIIRRY